MLQKDKDKKWQILNARMVVKVAQSKSTVALSQKEMLPGVLFKWEVSWLYHKVHKMCTMPLY